MHARASWHNMGAWMSNPNCGVPVPQMVGVAGNVGIVEACAAANVPWVCGFLGIVAIVLVILSLTWKRKDGDGNTTSVVPLWSAAIPLGLAAAWGVVAVPLARARLRVAEADIATSGMSKRDWLMHRAADDRTAGQIAGAIGASGVIATTMLATR